MVDVTDIDAMIMLRTTLVGSPFIRVIFCLDEMRAAVPGQKWVFRNAKR